MAVGRKRMPGREPTGDAAFEGEALLKGLRAGDDVAFQAMIRQYGGRLLAVARRLLRHEEDARDCVQETFLQAFRQIEQFEGRAALGTWLHRIAVNQALARLRKRAAGREESVEDLQPAFDAWGTRVEPVWHLERSVDDLLDSATTRRAVREKIDSLPPRYRTVLMLRDIEELSTREVAEVLGDSEGAVKVRLHRARAALRTLLEPHWRELGG